MNRKEAIALLKEIKLALDSFDDVSSVSVTERNRSGNWVLQVHWTPEITDKSVLDAIAEKRGLEMFEEKGHTIFR